MDSIHRLTGEIFVQTNCSHYVMGRVYPPAGWIGGNRIWKMLSNSNWLILTKTKHGLCRLELLLSGFY